MDENGDANMAISVLDSSNGSGNAGALVTREESKSNQLTHYAGVQRTSSLHAPIMKLEGHTDAVLGCDFSPSGQHLLSCSADNRVFLWTVYGEELTNYAVMTGHKNAVLEARWSGDGRRIVTCSADKRGAVWDAETGQRVHKFHEHQSFVNSCDISSRAAAAASAAAAAAAASAGAAAGPATGAGSQHHELYATASDDRTVRVWDGRQKRSVRVIRHPYEVTAVCFDSSGSRVISGSLDNVIRVFDVATAASASAGSGTGAGEPGDETQLNGRGGPVFELHGHSDTITGLAIAPDGTHVLSNSMDCTARVWDVRPYCAGERCQYALVGHQHTAEKNLLRCAWSPDGMRVAAGSGDRHCMIWSLANQKVLYRLPGHKGSVNAVAFHPKEPIIASAGSDNAVFVGEIQP